jgi:hypothetical protein
VFLANKFVERARSHPRRERRGFVHRIKIDILCLKQVLHGKKLRWRAIEGNRAYLKLELPTTNIVLI